MIGNKELEETRAALTELAGKRFGKLPAAPFVDLILRSSSDADWPVRKAAMEALLRRVGFGKRDTTVVLRKPGRAVLGCYRVGAKGTPANRGYETELCALEPLQTSCNCPDFVRGSLGLCKHGLAVLFTLDPATWAGNKVATEQAAANKRATDRERTQPHLRWDAVAPLSGGADRLDRLTLTGDRRALASYAKGRPQSGESWAPAQRLKWVEQQLSNVRGGRWSAEPAVVKVLEEEKARAGRLALNAKGLRVAQATSSRLLRTLYDYQKQGVRQFLENGRLLLADDMGLGKTTQAIACCHALYETGRIERGLLVVPAALRSQWLREWRETTKLELTEVQGTPEERAQTYDRTKRGLLLIGYELLLRDLPHVQAFAPQLVLLDEAQRIKNWATKSAACVKSLKPEYRLVLTGTPMENRFDELASLMDFVDDTALEPKWRLVPWHTRSLGDGARGSGGARNLGVLRERLGTAFLRRRRAEVLSQLPARTDTRLSIELTPEQTEEHGYLDQPIAALVRKAQFRPLQQAEFLKLMQLLGKQRMICNGLAQVNFEEEWPRCQATKLRSQRFLQTLFSPKLVAFRELVEQMVVEQNRKLVVFSQWRKMLRLANWCVEDVLGATGKRAAFFTGAESRPQRERALIDFHDDPTSAILFLSDAGGVGLNLQRAASCCINLELPWNPAVLEQRIGRVYRLGQTEPVEVINLVSETGIESRVAELVTQKQAVFSTLFDGTSDEVLFDGDRSFLGGVRKLMEPAPEDEVAASSDADREDELEELIAAETPAAEPAAPAPDPASAALANALAGLSITQTAAGGLRIEAPPALAAPLAQFFEGLAASLKAAAAPDKPG